MSKSRKAILIILKIGMLICLGIGVYPVVAQAYTYYQTQHTLNEYQQEYEKATKHEQKEKYDSYLKKNKQRKETDQTELIEIPEENPKLESHANLQKDKLGDVLGEIIIPKISVDLPLFDGVNDYQLSEGAGVLNGTDLPTGGEGNHSVISAHSGIPEKKLFTDLSLLKLKDKFFIKIQGQNLEYEIDQIKTILPSEFKDLLPVEGQDYITLMTCTPIGKNTHRLLVRGKRIPFNKKDLEQEKKKDTIAVKAKANWYPVTVIGVLVLILFVYLAKKVWRKRRNKNEK